MIKIIDNYFILETINTSYIFKKHDSLHLIHLYYGKKIDVDKETLKSLENNIKFPIGSGINYSKEFNDLYLEVTPLEVSSLGKGDIRTPMIELINPDSSNTSNFLYESHIIDSIIKYETLPYSKGESESLIITLKDFENNIELKIAYNVFLSEDVITRQATIKNLNKEEIKLKKAYSLNLDLKNDDYIVRSFHGHWANEMNLYDRKLVIGEYVNETRAGVSSNRVNPFFMLYKDGAKEDIGDVFGFNLIYSGNHKEILEVDSLGNLRVLFGINPETFEYLLKENEIFEIPEAIMSYSQNGFNGLSQNLHSYIRSHIIDKEFVSFPRKVLNNSWEACYFNFNEKKLLSMARLAKKLGVELFVLDDGWFKGRNDDTSSLGDWIEDKKKLKSGLKGFGEKIRKLGLEFGIWVEPEMISEKSDLYQAHEDWALKIEGKPHSLGRNQMILDLSNKDVVDYLFKSLCYVIDESKCTYLKWDMNRIFSDYYSMNLKKDEMMELNHKYCIGLYSLFKRLKMKYPKLLIEGCASGGNRFDLGILSYCPQIWASDNTDAYVRMNMQYNYSYGYPISTLGAHIASSPCLNTLRRQSLDTRFSVSVYGAFGYEIDLRDENKASRKEIIKQIELYKSIRDKLIDSDYYRIRRDDSRIQFESISKDKELSLVTDYQIKNNPIDSYTNIKVKGLNDDYLYRVTSPSIKIDIKTLGGAINYISPIHIKDGGLIQNILSKIYKMYDKGLDLKTNGSILNNEGLNVNESFSGAGINNDMRIIRDFESRLYIIKKE